MNRIIGKDDKPAKFLKVDRFLVELHDPATQETFQKGLECVVRGNSVAVILHRLSDNKFIFAEQPRIGPMHKNPDQPLLLEFVAGMVDPGESPEKAAVRETKEEVGANILSIEKVTEYWKSAGMTDERMTVLYATIDDTPLPKFGGKPEERECITVHELSIEEVEKAITDGRTDTSHFIIGWQWLKLAGIVPNRR